MLTSAEAIKTETNVRDGRPGGGQAAQPQAVLRDAPRVADDPCPSGRRRGRQHDLESRVSKTIAEDVHALLAGGASPTAAASPSSTRAEKGRHRAGEAGGDPEGDRRSDGHPRSDPG